MPAALEAVDLLTLCLFAFLLAFLYSLKWTITPLLQALHKALGWVPFAGDLIGKAENGITTAINGAIVKVREGMGVLFSALVWSFGLVAEGVTDIADGFKQRWTGLLNDALPLALGNVYSAASLLVKGVTATVDSLATTVESNAKAAERTAKNEAAAALSQAKTYTDNAVSGILDKATSYADAIERTVESDITAARNYALDQAKQAAGTVETAVEADIAKARDDFTAAISAATGPLSDAIDGLRSDLATAKATLESEVQTAENTASGALAAATAQLEAAIQTAETAAENAATAALSGAEADLTATINTATAAAQQAIATAKTTLEGELSAATGAAAAALTATAQQLQSAITAAAGEAEDAGATLAAAGAAAAGELADIYNLPVDTLRDLLDKADLTTIGGFGIGVVLLRAVMAGVLADTGLENESCRAKVKQVCATDPAQWGNLLAGLAALGFAFNLRDLYNAAEPLVGGLAGVIRQAA